MAKKILPFILIIAVQLFLVTMGFGFHWLFGTTFKEQQKIYNGKEYPNDN